MKKYFFIIIALCVLAGCAGKGTDTPGGPVFDSIIYEPDYASGFTISGKEGSESVMLSVSNPWQGADSVVQRLLIVRGGEEVPEGFDGQVLRGDAKRIVAMSSTHVAMLDALGATDRVVAVSGPDYFTNPRILARRDSLADAGYEGNVNFEALIASSPDLVLLYGVNGASSMERKLNTLGIPYVYIGDYLEQSPLGKAEWMVAIAEITGLGNRGRDTFSQIAERYEALRKEVASDAGVRPKVMLNVPYGDSWFMPSASSYMAQLIRDAGGEYVYKKDTGNSSRPIGMEEAYLLASEADVWLNLDRTASAGELKARWPRFADTGAVVSGRLYNNTRRANSAGGNDFFESGIVNPDVILRDLIGIFHPALSDGDPYYYKRLE
ncbi:MAG: ABC transporter substrate-binding protein [Muribaculaceae bacterium]|nr:ABC transporter substrate-binding protein [Muribaculaceae bacterium]